MDRRFPVVLICSALFATCVAGLFYRLASSVSRPVSTVKTRAVVVAATDLAVGTMIRPSDLKLVPISEASFPRNAFSDLAEVQGRAVMARIFLDEPVLQDRLAILGSPAGLAPMIAPGQRAVAVRVNDVISVAGFVQPGMKVDVVLTGHPPGSQNSASRTVLQNILVLSAGQILQAEPKGQPINAAVVTLQVNPEQAEILILAGAEGKVQLVLRNSTDARIEPPKGAQLSSLFGAPPIAEALPLVARVAPQRRVPEPVRSEPVQNQPVAVAQPAMERAIVEVIRGSKKSLDTINPPATSSQPLN
jgi:pilus assembly protein CpaB